VQVLLELQLEQMLQQLELQEFHMHSWLHMEDMHSSQLAS